MAAWRFLLRFGQADLQPRVLVPQPGEGMHRAKLGEVFPASEFTIIFLCVLDLGHLAFIGRVCAVVGIRHALLIRGLYPVPRLHIYGFYGFPLFLGGFKLLAHVGAALFDVFHRVLGADHSRRVRGFLLPFVF